MSHTRTPVPAPITSDLDRDELGRARTLRPGEVAAIDAGQPPEIHRMGFRLSELANKGRRRRPM